MTDIEKRISELEKKIRGNERNKEAIEAERVEIEKYERIAVERLKKIREEVVR